MKLQLSRIHIDVSSISGLVIGGAAALGMSVMATSVQADGLAATGLNRDLAAAADASSNSDTRYGLFNGLDHRSFYNEGDYPEPFLVDDTGLEINEARLDWRHTQTGNVKTDVLKSEFEHGFGPVTVEVEVPYVWQNDSGTMTQGFDNIDLGVRSPFFEYVSANGYFDTTLGGAFEGGIPASSSISVNPEYVPKIFGDTKLGDHFTVQTILGYSTFGGGGPQGGLQTFEYGFVFGYFIDHDQLPLPGVARVIPIFELQGGRQMNQANAGEDSLLGDVGLRLNLRSIGRVQPRPGITCIFPLDGGARADTQWGLAVSMVFEF